MIRYAHRVSDWLVPGLNGDKGLIRMHYTDRKRKREECQLHLLPLSSQVFQYWHGPIPYPVTVFYKRYCITLMDWDNACASFKTVGDALVHSEVLIDDGPKHIVRFIPDQERVPHRAEQGFSITLEVHVEAGRLVPKGT